MSRRRLCFLVVFLSIAMAFVALWYTMQPPHRINEHTSRQIEEGMTLAEVEAVFGVPAGDYSTRVETYDHHVRPKFRNLGPQKSTTDVALQ